MENVPAVPEGDAETIVVRGTGIGLVFDARLIERVAADGAGVGTDVPGPHGD
jgi:hypothetical protein